MTIAAIEHVVIDDNGVPRIAGSRIRVSQIAAEYEQHGRDAEAVWKNHDHLSRAQIFAALAYYFDHVDAIRAELDASDAAHDAVVEAQKSDPRAQAILAKLKAQL